MTVFSSQKGTEIRLDSVCCCGMASSSARRVSRLQRCAGSCVRPASKTSRAFGAWETYNAWLLPGANAGDYFSGDLRRPFTDAGMWGLLRIFDPACSAGCPERLG